VQGSENHKKEKHHEQHVMKAAESSEKNLEEVIAKSQELENKTQKLSQKIDKK